MTELDVKAGMAEFSCGRSERVTRSAADATDAMSCCIRKTALALVLSAGSSMAQDLRMVDDPPMWGPTVGPDGYGQPFVTDTCRGRIVGLDVEGETREWDGQRWLRRPIPAQSPPTLRVFDEAARNVLAQSASATWTYDGATWRQLHPAHTPSGLGGRPSLVFDVVRQRPLMCFGADASGLLNVMWEWTGSDWVQLQPPVSPPARQDAALACDRSRGVVALFGGSIASGLLNDTWEWNGSTWQQQQLAVQPGARAGHVMGCDDSRQRVVLFGGSNATSNLNDTWEYDGSWHPITSAGPVPPPSGYVGLMPDPISTELVLLSADGSIGFRWNGVRWQSYAALPTRPAFRSNCGAAYEPTTGGIVMFGGEPAGGGPSSETWRWDGQTWSHLQAAGPSGRSRHAMWHDFNQVFLFGGVIPSSRSFFSDTWRWDGVNWTAVVPPTSPPARSDAAVTFDLARGRAVLFGGLGPSVGFFDDTWTFDGANWQLEHPAAHPPARFLHGLADDAFRGRVVLWGGQGTTPFLNDTWEWDGANWTQVTTAFSPPGGGQADMDFDWRLGRVVLIQRNNLTSQATLFVYDGANWSAILASPLDSLDKVVHRLAVTTYVLSDASLRELSLVPAVVDRYGNDCGADPLLLTARSSPWSGTGGFGLDALHAPGGGPVLFAFGSNRVDIPIGPCRQLVAPVLASVILLANAGGFATLDVPIPPSGSLIGAGIFAQSAALDPSLSIGFRTSAGLHLVVGD